MPFKKGESGNPGGRPKVIGDVQDLAREYTTEAVKTLASIARDKKEPAAARVTAANSLLDRGYGKPAQTLNVNRRKTIEDISDDELIEIARQADAKRRGNGTAAEKGSPPSSDSVH